MSSATPLILASASPRRHELLAHLGVAFTVLPAEIDERVPERVSDPAHFARNLAEAKARAVTQRHPTAAILAADTIVVLDREILGKPANAEEARSTLQRLRNRTHDVITAHALAHSKNVWTDHATTSVVMRDYADGEIDAYVDTGEPFDKAGSYAIQDQHFAPVERCSGCYCNVVGLSIVLTKRLLHETNLPILSLNPPDLPPECKSCPLSEPQQPMMTRW